MIKNELQPWLVLIEGQSGTSLAMWRLTETGQPALALFTSETLADEYAGSIVRTWSTVRPEPDILLSLMAECYQQGVALAVLDPDRATARKIYDLAEVLRAAREELKRSAS